MSMQVLRLEMDVRSDFQKFWRKHRDWIYNKYKSQKKIYIFDAAMNQINGRNFFSLM